MLGNGNDVVAGDHERLAGAPPVAAAFFEHCREARPGFGRAMLAAEFTLAVPPAARRDDGSDARINAGCVDGNRRAKTATDQGDSLRIDLRMRGQKGERVAGIGNLLKTDHPAAL